NSKLLRKLARYYVTIGKPQYGRQLLEAAIQNGGWHKAGLWYDLVAAMSHSGDYQSIRSLWLRTPVKCHNNVSVLRAVARAACVSGEHGDSRALLRRAALATSSEVNGRGTTSRFKASI